MVAQLIGGNMSLISGPIAPERNPNIHPEWYLPSRFVIASIENGLTTTVTMNPSVIQGVTIYPNYVIGQQVRFNIPNPYGIQQINEQTGFVISIPSSLEVIVDIDSSSFDQFNSSPSNSNQVPQIIGMGDVNTGVINASGRVNLGTFVPGAFIDISPSVGGTS